MSKTARLLASLLLAAAAVVVGVAPCSAGAAGSAGVTHVAVADAPQQGRDCGACWGIG